MDRETTLRDIYEALNAGDAARAATSLTDDCTFHILPNPLMEARTLRGRTDVESFMHDVVSTHGVQQHVDGITLDGDFAAVFVTSTSKDSSGAEQHIRWADLFRFEADQVAEHVALST